MRSLLFSLLCALPTFATARRDPRHLGSKIAEKIAEAQKGNYERFENVRPQVVTREAKTIIQLNANTTSMPYLQSQEAKCTKADVWNRI
jgi:hypothetical protein